jgi:hypothetical protein
MCIVYNTSPFFLVVQVKVVQTKRKKIHVHVKSTSFLSLDLRTTARGLATVKGCSRRRLEPGGGGGCGGCVAGTQALQLTHACAGAHAVADPCLLSLMDRLKWLPTLKLTN